LKTLELIKQCIVAENVFSNEIKLKKSVNYVEKNSNHQNIIKQDVVLQDVGQY